VLKCRSESITNDDRISALRRQIELENTQSRQIHKFLLSLNALVHQNTVKMQNIRLSFADTEFKTQTLSEIITQHNSLMTEQLSALPRSESQRVVTLTSRIAALRKQIDHEKSLHPEKVARRDELDRIKRKSRFYKREYDLLQEFVRKELDFEREEDEAAVEGLSQTIVMLSKELESERAIARTNQEEECAKVFEQIDSAKRQLEEKVATLGALEAAKAQTRAAIEWQTISTDRLARELAILREMAC
jgi:hypothetical protein